MSFQKFKEKTYFYRNYRMSPDTDKKLKAVKKKIDNKWDKVFRILVENFNQSNLKK